MEICCNNFIAKMNSELAGVIRLIKAELQNRGLDQNQLALALGKTGAWLSRIMHDKRRLTVQTLFDIAKILSIQPASLIPHDAEGNPSPKIDFDEYIKKIVREEISKLNKKES